jgi:hypothetical protein
MKQEAPRPTTVNARIDKTQSHAAISRERLVTRFNIAIRSHCSVCHAVGFEHCLVIYVLLLAPSRMALAEIIVL